MEIDQNLLGQVSDFLKTSEGAEIMAGLKSSLGLDKEKQDKKDEGSIGDLSALFSEFSKPKAESSPFQNIDIKKLIPLVSAISSAKTDDRATNLLIALKPLLNPERRPKIDHAISIMRIMSLIPILEEHGFSINDIFS